MADIYSLYDRSVPLVEKCLNLYLTMCKWEPMVRFCQVVLEAYTRESIGLTRPHYGIINPYIIPAVKVFNDKSAEISNSTRARAVYIGCAFNQNRELANLPVRTWYYASKHLNNIDEADLESGDDDDTDQDRAMAKRTVKLARAVAEVAGDRSWAQFLDLLNQKRRACNKVYFENRKLRRELRVVQENSPAVQSQVVRGINFVNTGVFGIWPTEWRSEFEWFMQQLAELCPLLSSRSNVTSQHDEKILDKYSEVLHVYYRRVVEHYQFASRFLTDAPQNLLPDHRTSWLNHCREVYSKVCSTRLKINRVAGKINAVSLFVLTNAPVLWHLDESPHEVVEEENDELE